MKFFGNYGLDKLAAEEGLFPVGKPALFASYPHDPDQSKKAIVAVEKTNDFKPEDYDDVVTYWKTDGSRGCAPSDPSHTIILNLEGEKDYHPKGLPHFYVVQALKKLNAKLIIDK